jgi:hypothetical protein
MAMPTSHGDANVITQGLGSTNVDRRRRIDCVAAVLLAALASCGDEFALPTSPDLTTAPTWELVAMATESSVSVSSIWGDPSGELFALRRVVLHYDGSAWSRTGLGGLDGFDVWGSSADDVFVVGKTLVGGSIAHYDGDVWTTTYTTKHGLYGVWGSSAKDVYAVGESSTILHYDGVSWTPLDPPPDGNSKTFQDVWGSSSSDIFVVGSDRVYHYDGSSWSVSLESGGSFIWGNAGDDAYVGGPQWQLNGAILHYNGHEWTRMETGTQQDILGAWGSSSNDMFFVGRDNVLHWDGATWTESLRFPAGGGYGRAIWGRSHSDVFVDGSQLYHYDGSAWRSVLGYIDGGIDKVCVVSDSEVLTFGRDGDGYAVSAYDGAEWRYRGSFHEFFYGYMLDAWVSSGGDAFMVGWDGEGNDSDGDGYNDGYLSHYNATNWTPLGSQLRFPRGFAGVWGTSESDVFAVGAGGIIVHYDGSQWSPMSSGTTSWLWDVWGSSSTDVFAVGTNENDDSVILHYDGSSWSEMVRFQFQEQTPLRKIWGSSGRDVYMLSPYGQLRHYDGTTWSLVFLEGTYFFWDVWGRSRDDVYGATTRGLVHYDGSSWRPVDSGTEIVGLVWGTRSDVFGYGSGCVYRLGPR